MTVALSLDRPYPGIRPFQKSEWPIFYGRQRMIDAVLSRLSETQFVLLHGTSGCGKSSIVKAGVLPRLEAAHHGHGKSWHTSQFRPGGSPLWNFAGAIARLIERKADDEELSVDLVRKIRRRLNQGETALTAIQQEHGLGTDGNTCILIDQFEELFRYSTQIERAEVEMFSRVLQAFADAPPKGIHAIATMRSDFLGDCARYIGFAELINKTQYLLPRLEEEELMESISAPAEVFGAEVDPELAVQLIEDSRDEVDALPLVQHCLMCLWQQALAEREASGRDEPIILTVDNYLGLKKTLSTRADAVLADLAEEAPGAVWCAEQVFRAVIEEDADGRAIRRPTRLSELKALCERDPAALDACLARFSDADTGFLVLSRDDDPIVDISHEALIRCWSRLSDLDEYDAEGRAVSWIQRETDATQIWRSMSVLAREKGIIPAGVLEDREALVADLPGPAWAERHGGHWDDVQDLLQRSRAAVEAEEKAEERERRRTRRVVYGLTAGMVLLAGLSATAWTFYAQANQLSQETESQRAELESSFEEIKALRSQSLENRWRESLANALGDPEVRKAYDRSSVRAQIALYYLTDGQSAGAQDVGGTPIRIVPEALETDLRNSLDARTSAWTVKVSDDEVDGVAFSPDGAMIAAGADDGRLHLIDPSDGSIRQTWLAHDGGQLGQVAFSPAGTFLASAGFEGGVRVWSVETQAELGAIDTGARNWGIAWTPDGSAIAVGSDGGAARLWHWDADKPIDVFPSNSEMAMGIALGPDGDTLAIAPLRSGIQLHSLAAPGAAPEIIGSGEYFSVSWSEDGRYLAGGSDDGTVVIWDQDTGATVATIKEREAIRALAFAPNGQFLATGSDSGDAKVWSVPEGRLVAELRGHTNDVDAMAWSPGSDLVVTGSDSGEVRGFAFEPNRSAQPLEALIGEATERFRADSQSGDNPCLAPQQWRDFLGADAPPDWCLGPDDLLDEHIRLLQAGNTVRASRSLEQLVALKGDAAVAEMLVDAIGNRSLGQGDTFNQSDTIRRLIASARTLDVQDGRWKAQLAILEYLNGEGDAVDDEQVALLLLESLSSEAWPAEDAIAGDPFLASLFARPLASFETGREPAQITRVSVDADGQTLAAGTNAGLAFTWAASDGQLMGTYQHDDSAQRMADVALSPDGSALATANFSGEFRFWDLADGQAAPVIVDEAKNPYAISWSADGRFLAIGSDDEVAEIWDRETADLIARVDGHAGGVRDIALSPDGRKFITGSNDATARLWDVSQSDAVHLFSYETAVTAVDYSPLGTRVAVGTANNLVEIRNAATGEVEASLQLDSTIDDLAFSPDGQFLAVAASTANIWNVDDGARRLGLEVNGRGVRTVAWVAGSDQLVTGAEDGSVTLWSFGEDALLAALDARLQRCLSAEERSRFNLDPEPPLWCDRFEGQ